MGLRHISKAFTALDSWSLQKSGSFKSIVKDEVTVDVSGMITIPMGGLCLFGMFPLVYYISYGVGSALLVLRCDGYARCLEVTGRVTSTDPALFSYINQSN